MKLETVPLPTEKQYLYYLIISQLYSDGHMDAGMRLEMSVLDSAGQVLPSNRLSSILSACLLSFSDIADYMTNRENNSAKPLTPPSPPISNPLHPTNVNPLTRKRLHSGPPSSSSSYPPSSSASYPPSASASFSRSSGHSSVFPPSSEGAYTTASSTSYSNNSAPYSTNSTSYSANPETLLDNGDTHKNLAEGEENIRSQLSKELEEICNAAVADVRPDPPKPSPTPHIPQKSRQTSRSPSSPSTTDPVSTVSRQVSASGDIADTEGGVEDTAGDTAESGVSIKIELTDVEEAMDPGMCGAASNFLHRSKSLEENVSELTGGNHSTQLNSTASPVEYSSSSADEAAQKLLDNLNSISNISEIGDINELTQSIVESLVKGTSIMSTSETDQPNNFENTTPSTSTSPIKDILGDSDGSSTAEYAPNTAQQILMGTPLTPNPDNFQQLNLYKQSNTLLNIMGYNCSNSRNKPFRRHRTRFNDDQVTAMEHYYTNVSRYARPDNGLPELIRETGLTHDTIMLWFQNKRARDKRKGWDDVGGGNDGKRPKTE